MSNVMMRNFIISILFFLMAIFVPQRARASLDAPKITGLSGAGRSGIPKEALYSNPASLGLLTTSSAYFYFTKPKIPEWNAGGRGVAFGAYDGESSSIKGAVGYGSVARARVENGAQVYEDRSETRLSFGTMLSGNISGGIAGRYIKKRQNGGEKKYFQGDLGFIFPVFSDIQGGLMYENLVKEENEPPPTVSGGVNYKLGYGFQFFADGGKILKGPAEGKSLWSLASEFSVTSDFYLRAGKFYDAFLGKKGWSLGVTWAGPKFSLDYGLRMSSTNPEEKDHVFGFQMQL